METTFVWILALAGAAVVLLGLFLVASERELKVRRREIEELLTKLESAFAGAGETRSVQPPADNAAEMAELRAQNRDLQNQLSAVSGKLGLSRRTIDELEASHQASAEDQADMQRVRAANEQLEREVMELRGRIEAQNRGPETTNQDSQEGYLQLQAEITALKRTLDDSQAKIRELEAAQQNVPDLKTIEAERQQERQSFHERIADLERRLLADQEKLSEWQTLRDGLTEAESARAALQEEISRREAEIPRWQARLAEAEENGRRFLALQAPCEELLSKQAALAEGQRQLQEEFVAFARLVGTPAQAAQSQSSASSSVAARPLGNGTQDQPPEELRVSPEVQAKPEAPQPEQRKQRRFGIFGS